jgi:protein associated with RNAse G/E
VLPVHLLQLIIDSAETSEEEKGWYLQEMARYYYVHSKEKYNVVQMSA